MHAVADPSTVPGIVDTVTSNSANLGPILVTVVGAGIGVAALILAVTKGWQLFRKAIKSS